MKKSLFLIVIINLIFASFAIATTIDSTTATYVSYSRGILSQWPAGQSFTIESGFDTHLDSIELQLGAFNSLPTSGNVTVDIYGMTGDLPTGAVLTSATKAIANTGWESEIFNFSYDFSDNTQYFFSVYGASGGNVNIGYERSDTYTGGAMYIKYISSSSWNYELSGNADIDFVMSLSDAGAVPEPATMMLFGIGLLSLAGVNRRKQ